MGSVQGVGLTLGSWPHASWGTIKEHPDLAFPNVSFCFFCILTCLTTFGDQEYRVVEEGDLHCTHTNIAAVPLAVWGSFAGTVRGIIFDSILVFDVFFTLKNTVVVFFSPFHCGWRLGRWYEEEGCVCVLVF